VSLGVYAGVPKDGGVSNASEWSFVTADAREATVARRAVRQFLAAEADAGSDLDGAETIVGELVSNVILHAPGPIGLYVSWSGESAVLIVSDRGHGIPKVRLCPDADAECGRGLLIVEALASSLEVYTVPYQGSRVVVELPVRRTLANAS
jgi:anti-sigma regulatory factor (Ser/Thr protein kinase)